MIRAAAPRCSRPGCARHTTDSSGACHDHRVSVSGASTVGTPPAPTLPIPEPPFEEFTPGVRVQKWRDENGDLHRADGPAVISLHQDSDVIDAEEWFVHGTRHRTDGPAETHRFEDGAVSMEMWMHEGTVHRRGGPARVTYSTDGTPAREHFYVHGLLHRIDGPAKVIRWSDGMNTEEFWLNGETGSKEDLRKKIVAMPDDELRFEFAASSYGVFLDEGHEPRAVADAIGEGIVSVDGIREVLAGAPPEWIRAWEEGQS